MSLSSLIVQRQVATMRQVEEALARQVIYGGDLVTNLLEVALVDESILVELLAVSLHLPRAPARSSRPRLPRKRSRSLSKFGATGSFLPSPSSCPRRSKSSLPTRSECASRSA